MAETGTYAVPLNGSGGNLGTRLPDELFSLCQSDGGDICFTSDSAGTTQLPVELVSIDTSAKTAEIWVAVPLTAATDATIYVWYGNGGTTLAQPAPIDTYGSQAVWSTVGSITSVWHLGETGSGAAGDYEDSTATAKNSTNTSGQPSAVSGQIGECTDLPAARISTSAIAACRAAVAAGRFPAGSRVRSR